MFSSIEYIHSRTETDLEHLQLQKNVNIPENNDFAQKTPYSAGKLVASPPRSNKMYSTRHVIACAGTDIATNQLSKKRPCVGRDSWGNVRGVRVMAVGMSSSRERAGSSADRGGGIDVFLIKTITYHSISSRTSH